MMQRAVDSAPAGIIGGSALAVLVGHAPGSESIERVLNYPWSVYWLIALATGALSVFVGVWLRPSAAAARNGAPHHRYTMGLYLEWVGNSLAGGMLIVYAVALVALAGWGSFLAIIFMTAFAGTFMGPWLLITRDLYRARQSDLAR